jgi:hypothetical protein
MIHSPSFLGYTRLGAETTAAKTDIREVRNRSPFEIPFLKFINECGD